jgi:CxxC-x17-CxxC domain-containing protein
MADFKRSGVKRFYENRGNGSSRQDTGRPAFAQKKWDGPSRPATMHKATCAGCGNPCEVPFRPFDNRLVYCNTCFQGKKGNQDNRGYNKFPQKDRADSRNFPKTGFRNDSGVGGGLGLKDQLEILNSKIDRLIKTVEAMANIAPASEESETEETDKKSPAAKTKKGGKKVSKNYKRPF